MQDLPIGARVREARQAVGMSQQTLASRAELAMRTVSRIEAGEDCTVGTLTKIAGVLGVSVGDLLEDTDSEPETISQAVGA